MPDFGTAPGLEPPLFLQCESIWSIRDSNMLPISSPWASSAAMMSSVSVASAFSPATSGPGTATSAEASFATTCVSDLQCESIWSMRDSRTLPIASPCASNAAMRSSASASAALPPLIAFSSPAAAPGPAASAGATCSTGVVPDLQCESISSIRDSRTSPNALPCASRAAMRSSASPPLFAFSPPMATPGSDISADACSTGVVPDLQCESISSMRDSRMWPIALPWASNAAMRSSASASSSALTFGVTVAAASFAEAAGSGCAPGLEEPVCLQCESISSIRDSRRFPISAALASSSAMTSAASSLPASSLRRQGGTGCGGAMVVARGPPAQRK
mmetsp:Transcript_89458/g.251971  ORF Transcript_89458/g.251971 Transcript_89458/m.251971 type:complete len:333 (-) Transcript_89458:24-1022(-)